MTQNYQQYHQGQAGNQGECERKTFMMMMEVLIKMIKV